MGRLIRLFCLLGLGAALLSGCKKEYYTLNTDESGDLKAMKIAQVGALFDNMARQPELADDLVAYAGQTLYVSYRDLLPLSDRAVPVRGTARGEAVGALFTALARQPGLYDVLDAAAERFIGPYDARYISPALNEFACTAAFPALAEALARQPELSADFDRLAGKYLNVNTGQ